MQRGSTFGICILMFAITLSACYDDLQENDDLTGENFEQEFEIDSQALVSPLPNCGGYWGWYAVAEKLEITWDNNSLYETGPNCSMPAPANHCGPDNDDMLSFYFGNHAESYLVLQGMLKLSSTSWPVYAALRSVHPRGYDSRIYQQTPSCGRNNYNIYVCINPNFRPFYRTLRIRKF